MADTVNVQPARSVRSALRPSASSSTAGSAGGWEASTRGWSGSQAGRCWPTCSRGFARNARRWRSAPTATEIVLALRPAGVSDDPPDFVGPSQACSRPRTLPRRFARHNQCRDPPRRRAVCATRFRRKATRGAPRSGRGDRRRRLGLADPPRRRAVAGRARGRVAPCVARRGIAQGRDLRSPLFRRRRRMAGRAHGPVLQRQYAGRPGARRGAARHAVRRWALRGARPPATLFDRLAVRRQFCVEPGGEGVPGVAKALRHADDQGQSVREGPGRSRRACPRPPTRGDRSG